MLVFQAVSISCNHVNYSLSLLLHFHSSVYLSSSFVPTPFHAFVNLSVLARVYLLNALGNMALDTMSFMASMIKTAQTMRP
jgi:hypothetical protein